MSWLTYNYDDLNRLILQKSVDKSGTVIAQYAYTLGKNGERTKVIESGACGSIETSYDYDKANRLVKEVIETDDEKTVYIYAYDAEGVRRSRADSEGTVYFVSHTAGSLSQTLAETAAEGNLLAAYTRGDTLISQTRGGETSYYCMTDMVMYVGC